MPAKLRAIYARCRSAWRVLGGLDEEATEARLEAGIADLRAKFDARCEAALADLDEARDKHVAASVEQRAAAAEYRRAAEILMVAINRGFVRVKAADDFINTRN